MAGKTCDVIPFDIFDIELPLAINSAYSREDLWSKLEVEIEIHKRKLDLYGIDYIYQGPNILNFCRALGGQTYTSAQGDGLIGKYPLETYDNIDSLMDIDISKNSEFIGILEKVKKIKEKAKDLTVFYAINGPMTIASILRPIESLLRDMRKDRENFEKIMSLSTKILIDSVKMYTEEFGPVFIKIADPFSTLDLMVQGQFEKFSLPYLTRLIDQIVILTEKKPMLHICGRTKPAWQALKSLQISRFSVDNIEDIGQLKEAMGDDLIIEGNIDPINYLVNGSPEDVKAETKRIITLGVDSPKGFVFNAGCSVPLNSKIKNIEALIETIATYGQEGHIGKRL